MVELPLKIFKKISPVWTSWLKILLPLLEIQWTHWFYRNKHNWRLIFLSNLWLLRYFHIKNALFSFKLELLLAMSSHYGIEFGILFNFTQRILERNWSFGKFWLIVLIIARREIQIVDVTSSAKSSKNKKFEANF